MGHPSAQQYPTAQQYPGAYGAPPSAPPSGYPVPQQQHQPGAYGASPQQGGYGAPPPQGAYGAPPPQGAYGAPPQQGAYGAPPPPGAYGAAPQQGVYGAPPQQGAYGAPPPHGAYGAPPQQGAYGAPPQQGAYGAPPQQGAYGAPPPQGAYGAPPPHGAYGAPPQQGAYGGRPPQGAYGAPPQQGAYGAPPQQGAYGAPPQHGTPLPPPGSYSQAPGNYATNPQAIPPPTTGQFGLPVTVGQHVAQFSQTFKVEELVASATQDSFACKDSNGRLRYKVDGSFTVNERKTMKDMNGRVLLKIKEARMSMREKITISDAQGLPALTIQQKSGAQMGAKTANAYLGGKTSGTPLFTINGNRNATHFRLTSQNGVELCVIARKAGSLKTRLTGQDSYETTVMPGVDQALMCMVTVACDEIWSD